MSGQERDALRMEFEADFIRRYKLPTDTVLPIWPNGRYFYHNVQNELDGWRAARAAQPAAPQTPTEHQKPDIS